MSRASAYFQPVELTPPRGVQTLDVRDLLEDGLELNVLTVKPGHRGQGVGTKALNLVKALGRPIRLLPWADDGKERELRRFYLRNGFRKRRGSCYLCWFPPSTP